MARGCGLHGSRLDRGTKSKTTTAIPDLDFPPPPVAGSSLRDSPMSGSRLVLLANHLPLAQALQSALEKLVGHASVSTTFEAMRTLLGPDSGGVVLLAAGSAADVEAIVGLVQE